MSELDFDLENASEEMEDADIEKLGQEGFHALARLREYQLSFPLSDVEEALKSDPNASPACFMFRLHGILLREAIAAVHLPNKGESSVNKLSDHNLSDKTRNSALRNLHKCRITLFQNSVRVSNKVSGVTATVDLPSFRNTEVPEFGVSFDVYYHQLRVLFTDKDDFTRDLHHTADLWREAHQAGALFQYSPRASTLEISGVNAHYVLNVQPVIADSRSHWPPDYAEDGQLFAPSPLATALQKVSLFPSDMEAFDPLGSIVIENRTSQSKRYDVLFSYYDAKLTDMTLQIHIEQGKILRSLLNRLREGSARFFKDGSTLVIKDYPLICRVEEIQVGSRSISPILRLFVDQRSWRVDRMKALLSINMLAPLMSSGYRNIRADFDVVDIEGSVKMRIEVNGNPPSCGVTAIELEEIGTQPCVSTQEVTSGLLHEQVLVIGSVKLRHLIGMLQAIPNENVQITFSTKGALLSVETYDTQFKMIFSYR